MSTRWQSNSHIFHHATCMWDSLPPGWCTLIHHEFSCSLSLWLHIIIDIHHYYLKHHYYRPVTNCSPEPQARWRRCSYYPDLLSLILKLLLTLLTLHVYSLSSHSSHCMYTLHARVCVLYCMCTLHVYHQHTHVFSHVHALNGRGCTF